VAGPLEPGVEGILYADIDLEETLLPKLRHDIGGSYNRFDIMRVLINRTRHQSVEDTAGEAHQPEKEIPDAQPFDQQTEQCPEGSH
jgi:hypothetical protein